MENLKRHLIAKKKTGDEKITTESGKTIGTISSYWQWTHSDIIENTERGIFAEYLVACALGVSDNVRTNFDAYDLKTKDNITIEVKSSAYIQSWPQDKLSTILFSIRPTKAWNPETNSYDAKSKRQSLVYVFCVLNYKSKDDGLNPLDTKQWDFYVLPTKILNKESPVQKNITLSRLLKLGAVQCRFENLAETISNSNY